MVPFSYSKNAEGKITGFPIHTLLECYLKFSRRFYVNHFEEFKLFREYVGTLAIPEGLTPTSVPDILCTYELGELSRILGVHHSIVFQIIMKLHEHHMRQKD